MIQCVSADHVDGGAQVSQITAEAAARLTPRLLLGKAERKFGGPIAGCLPTTQRHYLAWCRTQVQRDSAVGRQYRRSLEFVLRQLGHFAWRELAQVGMNGLSSFPAMSRCVNDG